MKQLITILLLLLVATIAPPLLYLQSTGSSSGISIVKANDLLNSIEPGVLLVNIRTPEEYTAGTIKTQDANSTTQSDPPRLEFSDFEQIAIVIAAFAIKPFYELLALVLVIILWKSLASDLVALRRGLLAFFLGENACAVNFLFFNEQSVLWEYLHCMGMLVAFGMVSYSIMLAVDYRILHFSDRNSKCTMLPLCGECYKYTETACKVRLLYLFAILCSIALAGIMLCAPIERIFFTGTVFGGEVVFGHAWLLQYFEVRICPLLGIIFLAAAFFLLLYKKEKAFKLSKILFAIGLGPIGFGFMRFIIFWCFQQRPLWADFWEEISELMFIVGAFVIVRIFRKTLLKQ